MKMDFNVDPIHKILLRNRNLDLLYSFIAVLSGFFLVLDPWDLTGLSSLLLTLTAALISFAGLWTFVNTLKHWNLEETGILQIIKNRPRDVVWVYHQILESMPFGVKTMDFTTLHIKLIDGESEQLRLSKNETDQVLSFLRTKFPVATFGHSIEKEQLYLANPKLLINNNKSED